MNYRSRRLSKCNAPRAMLTTLDHTQKFAKQNWAAECFGLKKSNEVYDKSKTRQKITGRSSDGEARHIQGWAWCAMSFDATLKDERPAKMELACSMVGGIEWGLLTKQNNTSRSWLLSWSPKGLKPLIMRSWSAQRMSSSWEQCWNSMNMGRR